MMRSQLLLTILLVAAGLFLYDTIRGDAPAASPDRDLPRGDEGASAPRVGAAATLSSAVDPGARAAVERQAARLEALEKALAAHLEAAAATPGQPADAGVDEVPRLQLGEDDLDRFEAYLAAVERRRQERRTAAGIGRSLDALGIEITADQRKAVIARRMAYQSAVAEAARTTDPTRLPEKLRVLAQEYEQTLFRAVRASDARTILEAMPPQAAGAGGTAAAESGFVDGVPRPGGR